ncbi:MAG: adenylate kinase [Methanomassiliicoccales archaeon]|jgi:adenylate kinase|nr:adenylate kinase [Methanomassiliicoccales archaeon]
MHALVLLGPPGSGKGTQAARLAEELKLIHISTGDMLREAIRKGTTIGLKAKNYVDRGELVPDEVVTELIREKISGMSGVLLFDGYPRNLVQAKMLDEIVLVKAAINLDVDENKIVERLTKRRTCKQCGAVYNLETNPPAIPGKCDKCGGELYQRSDDTEGVVRQRLRIYKEATLPLIEYYRKKGVLFEVNGDGSIDEVFERIRKELKGVI